jgi:hypothetical protein
MAIAGTSTDYTGRQLDLELLQSIANPVGSQAVSVSTVQKPPKVVTGVEKLVQRYALLFLTVRGELVYDIMQGTDFIQAMLMGSIQDQAALQAQFAAANELVLGQLQQDDDAVTTFGQPPDDELIASVQLLDSTIDYATATVMLSIELTTRAGTSVTFVLPATTIR